MSTQQATPLLITAGKLADALQISRSTLWRMRQSPSFPKPIELRPNKPYWYFGQIQQWLLEQSSMNQT